jgi:hypothetical protein
MPYRKKKRPVDLSTASEPGPDDELVGGTLFKAYVEKGPATRVRIQGDVCKYEGNTKSLRRL